MATGKSTLARHLAKATHRWMLDTDTLIESMSGQTVSETFATSGEGAFRSLEIELSKWLQGHVQGAVIATGGGMPLVCNNLRGIGEVIWIDTPFELIYQRLHSLDQQAHRPLAQDETTLKNRYDQRRTIYEKTAHRRIEGSGTIDEVLRRIIG